MRAIVLVDHGSKVPAANEVVVGVAVEVFKARVERGKAEIVIAAHQEGASPSLDEAIDLVVKDGATSITVVPFFLAPGKHATEDVPRIAAAAAARHGVPLTVTPPLGSDVSRLADIVLALVRD